MAPDSLKLFVASRTAPKSCKAKAAKKISPQQTSAGNARAEGIRLFKLAGRPTGEQFVLAYGERGPKMTWQEHIHSRQRRERKDRDSLWREGAAMRFQFRVNKAEATLASGGRPSSSRPPSEK